MHLDIGTPDESSVGRLEKRVSE